MTLGTARIIQGDATHLPLDDSSVDLVITSPPYFGLRSYQDGGSHYDGQLGDEPTPREYVDNLITATREMIRVLKPTGSIWVNLGDKYQANANNGAPHAMGGTGGGSQPPQRNYGFRPKSLIGIPWRYALRAIDDLGLILRAEIIWSKPNGLPESVTDRVRRSHEVWFHFTKSPRYYSAIDHIRETHARVWSSPGGSGNIGASLAEGRPKNGTLATSDPNPLGKLPGSVWEIPTQPLTIPDHLGVDHYAAFPLEWPRRIIAGWSPPGICTACRQGRRPTATKTASHREGGYSADNNPLMRRPDEKRTTIAASTLGMVSQFEITGYVCDCPTPTIDVEVTEFDYELGETVTRMAKRPDPTWVNPAPTTPALVLDPFGGTGTTALAAKALGRHGITLDMSADYCRIARWRCSDPRELAAAMQVDKPAPVPPDQLDLLEGLLG